MELSENFVTLVGHLAWPIGTLIVLVIIRKQVISLISALREKIANPSTRVSAGHGWFEIGPEEQAKINSNVSDSDQIKDIIKGLRQIYTKEKTTDIRSEKDNISKLKEMVDQYDNLEKSDRRQENIIKKNELSVEMANYIFMHNISKEKLTSEEPQQGMIVALAEAIRFDPQRNDIYLLLKIANKVKKGHAGYKILQALDRLYQKWYIPTEFKTDIIGILDKYSKEVEKEDEPFKKKIEQTRRIMMKL
jgi:hypothetical protein